MDTQFARSASRTGQPPASYQSHEGLFAFAGEYLDAAEALEGMSGKHAVAALSSLAQGIELLAKSYLQFRGVREGDLRRAPFGHDLVNCLAEGARLGLRFAMSRREYVEMRRLSGLYRRKRLHYLFERPLRLPDLDMLMPYARRLQALVFDRVTAPLWQDMMRAGHG